MNRIYFLDFHFSTRRLTYCCRYQALHHSLRRNPEAANKYVPRREKRICNTDWNRKLAITAVSHRSCNMTIRLEMHRNQKHTVAMNEGVWLKEEGRVTDYTASHLVAILIVIKRHVCPFAIWIGFICLIFHMAPFMSNVTDQSLGISNFTGLPSRVRKSFDRIAWPPLYFYRSQYIHPLYL